MQKITPYLWFDSNLEDAVSFYTAVFGGSKVVSMTWYGEARLGPVGHVMSSL